MHKNEAEMIIFELILHVFNFFLVIHSKMSKMQKCCPVRSRNGPTAFKVIAGHLLPVAPSLLLVEKVILPFLPALYCPPAVSKPCQSPTSYVSMKQQKIPKKNVFCQKNPKFYTVGIESIHTISRKFQGAIQAITALK